MVGLLPPAKGLDLKQVFERIKATREEIGKLKLRINHCWIRVVDPKKEIFLCDSVYAYGFHDVRFKALWSVATNSIIVDPKEHNV